MKAPGELWIVASALGELVEEVVFVGGMIRPLLVTDVAAGPARPTKDVDCVVNVSSRAEYHGFGARLRERGFAECTEEGAPLCRWTVRGVRVDVMPLDPAVLGFSNVWYPSGIDNAVRSETEDGSIRHFDALHFCASKLESFLARGENDFLHHDMEDFIAIVDERVELIDELAAGPAEVKAFVAENVEHWLSDDRFSESLVGHLAGDPASQARLPMLTERLRRIAAHAAQDLRGNATAAENSEVPLARPSSESLFSSWRHRRGQPREGTWTLPAQVSLLSSNLDSVAYDAGSSVLTIVFHGGRAYEYSEVPENVYAGLLNAGSHGRYFHQWIKSRYPFRRL